MTYGMTKEQMIAANGELLKALRIKETTIAELEAENKLLRDMIRRAELERSGCGEPGCPGRYRNYGSEHK